MTAALLEDIRPLLDFLGDDDGVFLRKADWDRILAETPSFVAERFEGIKALPYTQRRNHE